MASPIIPNPQLPPPVFKVWMVKAMPTKIETCPFERIPLAQNVE
jgi:hypothetical protein